MSILSINNHESITTASTRELKERTKGFDNIEEMTSE